MANESWLWVLEERIPSITKAGSATLDKLLAELKNQQWLEQAGFTGMNVKLLEGNRDLVIARKP